MVKRIEKRWSTYDQQFFLLSLVLNPWEQLSCFSNGANFDHFRLIEMATQVRFLFLSLVMYRRLALRPESGATPEAEKAIGKAMGNYLAGGGCFQAWNDHIREGNILTVDEEREPVAFWNGYLKTDARDLALMSITLFNVVVNQAGVERVFSFLKNTTKDHRNRLGLDKMEKILKVHSHIRSEQREAGVLKNRKARQNHKNVSKLLDIARYGNLLQDQADEDQSERGRALVSSPEGWRLEMARWISAAREAATEEEEAPAVVPADVLEEDTIPLSRLCRPRKWQPMTLERPFGTGLKPSLRTRISRRMQEEEETYMLVMAELDADDDDPDAGAIEIDDDEVYRE
ncbi:hypothetical protein B0H14DRAFT_3777641 [Mycena olivaceomarginata]|nr:hypothetical protein B0H14DRAFT_3777641 [Mycena olivaceomarginata]